MSKKWFRVLPSDGLREGGLASVTCEHKTLCVTHHKGKYAALDNRCPHQGGPLAEGSIENGMLRCPWHGWDFDPTTGESPGGFDEKVETFPVEVRDNGIYVELETESPHVRTQSDVMAETLVNWGVRWAWGMVGHSNLGFADALRRREEDGDMRFFGVRHEGAAAFATSGYGKLTGKPAVCFAIAGPGATNLLTGLWDAHVDRAPVLAITGQVPTKLIGRGAFQEVDLASAFGGVARYSGTLQPHSDFGEITTLACKSSIVDRSVSHLVLPDDVQTIEAAGTKASAPAGRSGNQAQPAAAASITAAQNTISAAKRPAIVVGYGAREHMSEVIALAEKIGAPVLTTFKAKGQISDSHPLGCGVLGRSGTPVASWFMNEADLLIVMGASFSNHTGITSYKPIVQVDFDPMAIGRFHAVRVPVLGDIGVVCGQLVGALDGTADWGIADEIAARWRIWRAEKQARIDAHDGAGGVHAAAAFQALTKATPENAVIAVDVGNHAYSFGRYFEASSQRILMSGYLGSIGFAFPAAMGAWAATQEVDSPHFAKKVVAVTGDGGFTQYLAEYTTASKYGMNITHVLLNNQELGKISKEQRAGQFDVWKTSLHNPSYVDFARSCGVQPYLVNRASELEEALEKAMAYEGPSLVEITSDVLGI